MEKVRPEWMDGHCLCALAEVLKPRQLEKLSIDGRRERVRAFCEEVAAVGDASARLVRPQGDHARFEHHVVAEYLAGYWLSENWEERHERIVRVYFSEGMEELRTVFDRFMTAGLPLHKSVLDRTILMKNEAWVREQGLEAVDRAGRTALHLAAQSHRPEMVARLLAAGAALHAKDNLLGRAPLYYAVRARSWECAAVLVARGAQLDADVSGSRRVQRLLPRNTRSLVARYEIDWPWVNVFADVLWAGEWIVLRVASWQLFMAELGDEVSVAWWQVRKDELPVDFGADEV
ncbi:Uncharacterized protein GBIM_06001 [Gryllus bimaculatus]|nr:Uncharacterized protein GBIM_06001 [Gryllus bimaculatus]